jgi:rod shape-determining protein MreC
MYRRRRISPFMWTIGAVIVLILLLFFISRFDFPGWIIRGLSRLVPEESRSAYTAEEVEELRNTVGSLEGENAILRERIVRLQDTLDVVGADRGAGYELLQAQIIYRDHARIFATAIIDRGSADGVQVGMPVVDSRGLVGRVATTRAAISRIVLVSSPDCSFGIVDQRSRELGVVRGSYPTRWNLSIDNGDEEVPVSPHVLELEYLSPSADIRVHDSLVTSGLSGITPNGVRVGEVVEIVTRTEEDVYEIRVRPYADLDHLQSVAVVLYTGEEPEDLRELVEEAGSELGPPATE